MLYIYKTKLEGGNQFKCTKMENLAVVIDKSKSERVVQSDRDAYNDRLLQAKREYKRKEFLSIESAKRTKLG